MSGIFMGAAAGGPADVAFSGVFSRSQGSSPVTSLTRSVTVPGTVKFANVMTNNGTPQYQLNGGAATNVTNGGTLVLASGDSLLFKAVLTIAGQQASFDISDNSSGDLIESVTLTRT